MLMAWRKTSQKTNQLDVMLVSETHFTTRSHLKIPGYEVVNASQLKNLGPKFLIGGDFNAKHTWWGSRIVNPKVSALLKCVRELGSNLHSTGESTYWPSDPNKIPDLLDLGISRGIDPAKNVVHTPPVTTNNATRSGFSYADVTRGGHPKQQQPINIFNQQGSSTRRQSWRREL